MNKALLILAVSLMSLPVFSQLLTWTTQFPQESTSPFEITMDGSKGNQALNFYTPQSDVYVHTGVITNLSTSTSDWRYVRPANFNAPVPALNAPYVPSSFPYKWRFTITGGIRNFYGVTNPAETILKISMLFRNGNGSRVQRNVDGSDMYIPISSGSLDVRFTVPFFQPTFNRIPETITRAVGDNIAVTALASTPAAGTTMRLYFNGTLIQTAPASATISANPAITTAGTQLIVAEAFDGVNTKTDTLRFFVPAATVIQALPAGVKDGINYGADNTSATLVLYAPSKNSVTVIGDIPNSNWIEQPQYQMKKTPDGNYWWTTVTGLTPGTEYAFQYLVDGNLRIAEPYTEKVLDPWNDPFIPGSTYPAIKPYPMGQTTGIVSVLQTAEPVYNWQTTGYTRPDKRNLMVYELLLRDYLAAHDWKTLNDTLNYIKKLGINTIQLMPINEFEGNLSWGYNPDYYLAPDKYYGPKNELKAFIDKCHENGMAVVMDIALNHSFGLSPMVQLYFDAGLNRPSANNPWFNPVAKHAFNVGYDMNHESLATRYFTSRVISHWLTEYKIDGFRFDLSKGFTQTQTCDGNGANCNESAMANYDLSRINIWKRYYDTMQLKSPGSYGILEHFAANTEEIELSDYGMMIWGNLNYNFSEGAMGYVNNSNFDGALHVSRGWAQPHLIAYMESHDEERMMVRTLAFGNSSGGYNTRNLETALDRMELSAAFLLTIPGPKMIWQFGELGYDYSINYCPSDGSINNNCRTDNKPIRWDYLQVQGRNDLYNVYKGLLQLRNTSFFTEAFTTGFISRSLSGGFKWMTLNSSAGKVVVVGNFDVVAQSGNVTFPAAGTWYDYLKPPATFNATGGAQSILLQPGEYHVYTSSNVVLPVTLLNFNGKHNGDFNQLQWEVQNEQNLSHYEIERSTDGQNFTFFSRIAATGRSNYEQRDNDISKSIVYFYRLKKVDADARFSYSATIKLNGNIKAGSVSVTPNPFTDVLRVNISSLVKEPVTLLVTDLSGRQMHKQVLQVQAGVNLVEIAEAKKLSAGSYLLTIISQQQNSTIKILKSK
ncbi:MAG: T9SS type A sorting domain-containing protein [Gloeobacteraceae cyanobacterium ES-bin-316]|nr:T9SS type A sorting domain-containing protein [Ferruginibacter sp.]